MVTTVAAVDCGATSIRVCTVDLDDPQLSPIVVHRVAHTPVRRDDGSLRWDWSRIVAAVEDGLRLAQRMGSLASIGIDAWGVDYGLVDRDGTLLSPPHSYRSERTNGWRDVADRIGAEHLYRTTGTQLMPINTVFQLAAHDREELRRADGLLMLPELLVLELTGVRTGEVTSAGTAGLVDLATADWSKEVLDSIGVEPALMPTIRPPAERVGSWHGVPVHLVAGHDTASAVAALPMVPDGRSAFLATGTWFLAGTLLPGADTSAAAYTANFTNEPGALGGVRLLKNVTGLWLLEQLRAQWDAPAVADLVAAATDAESCAVFDPNDERLNGDDIEAAIRTAAELPASASRGCVVRSVLTSLAAATAEVLDELGAVTGQPVDEVHLIGGGVNIPLLVELLRRACARPVQVGPAEATAVGNALVQGVALGRFTR